MKKRGNSFITLEIRLVLRLNRVNCDGGTSIPPLMAAERNHQESKTGTMEELIVKRHKFICGGN